jgi:pilus assembly protein FimV
LTIGRPQGPVWIGKPLDVVIPLSLDATEAGGSLCLGAEVSQGDTALPDQRVTISLEPGANPANSHMHVRSTVPVEEPVITVSVRAGCDMKSTRSYVLLADVPTEIVPPAVRASGAQAPSSATEPALEQPAVRSRPRGVTSGPSSGQADAGAPPVRRSAPPVARPRPADTDAQTQAPRPPAAAPAPRRPAVAQAPAVPRATVPRAESSTPKPAAPKRATVAGAPRLQVDAMEPAAPTAAAEAGLKLAPQLTLPATEDAAKRAEAAAQWRALNAPPEEAQRDTQRMQALEATLAALREQTAQNQRTLLEVRNELAEARESRYRNPLVYALIFLLLLALVAIFMLWRLARRTAAPEWWGEAPPTRQPGGPKRPNTQLGLSDEDLEPDSEPDRSPPRRSANTTTFGATPFAPLEPEVADSGFDEPLPHPARLADGAPVRPVNTEELFDVQQQSDFFISLGQHDQAVAVLREHIADNPGTSALAYLDLLRIFHSLGRKDDYTRLAEEFERAFNADVPDFENFTDAGRGLEYYRGTLARIESQWPAPGTLALIEELVFRKPGIHEDGAFDLAAYQELLLLYSVAKEVIDPDMAPPAPVTPHSFLDTYGHGNSPDELTTATAPIEPESPPSAMQDGPTLPASIYGSIDDGLHHETVLVPDGPALMPDVPQPPPASPPRVRPGAEMDLAEFDKTAYETMPTPLEAPAPPAPSTDPHVIDFELFDPDTEAEIAPKPIIKRKP